MAGKSTKDKLLAIFRLPEAMLVGSFAGVILLGAIILTLPWAAQSQRISFIDALFTSTSAVCVTGLTVVDTGTAYNFFGQVVILLLIQAGGLGIMTFAGLFFHLLGQRLSLKSQALLHGSFFQQDVGVDFRRMFKQILWITAITEFSGAVLIFIALLWRATPPAQAIFSAVFHAVSAFCNAGFSIYKDNLIAVRDSHLFTFTIMALIVIGGLGHMVVRELWDKVSPSASHDGSRSRQWRLSVHSRVVLLASGGLILLGTAGLLILGLSPGETTWEDRIAAALFQSITARTAGFNTVDIGALPLASLLLLTFLMFVGGSPASCAGGIKTTALVIFLADLRAKLTGEREARLLDRRIPTDTVARVGLLIRLAGFWIILGLFLLLATEAGPKVGMHDVLFELVSAFGTVGLSTGITDKLTVTGKLWIIATMFLGRLGPLTLAIWIFPKEQTHVQYPDGRILIG